MQEPPQKFRQPDRAPGPAIRPDTSQGQHSQQDPGNVTLFRTANFFVHVVSPLLKTGSLIRTGALKTGALRRAGGGETILERVRWTSAEKQRLLAAQTRLLPQADPI